VSVVVDVDLRVGRSGIVCVLVLVEMTERLNRPCLEHAASVVWGTCPSLAARTSSRKVRLNAMRNYRNAGRCRDLESDSDSNQLGGTTNVSSIYCTWWWKTVSIVYPAEHLPHGYTLIWRLVPRRTTTEVTRQALLRLRFGSRTRFG
jgi:hypothetical protein